MQVEDSGLVEPPNYYTTEHIFDVVFHPSKEFMAYANINGEIKM
jgi:hypothetical protein